MAIITLEPSTLGVTNSYDLATDFEGASPILGRNENFGEFNLSVRTDGKGKFKAIKFSSRFRAGILTELHRIKGSKVSPVSEFSVLHLRRRNAEWVPYVSLWLALIAQNVRLYLPYLKSSDPFFNFFSGTISCGQCEL